MCLDPIGECVKIYPRVCLAVFVSPNCTADRDHRKKRRKTAEPRKTESQRNVRKLLRDTDAAI